MFKPHGPRKTHFKSSVDCSIWLLKTSVRKKHYEKRCYSNLICTHPCHTYFKEMNSDSQMLFD